MLMIAVFFGGSIFVHELGHFWAARRRGVKVERFSIGFGPAIFKWRGKDGVEYRLSWLPLGGYVALPQLADMRGLEGAPSEDPTALPSPNYATRMIVFSAGAAMNILFAFALATILWKVGFPAYADTQRAKIGHVMSEITLPDGRKQISPAAAAGLRTGDTILEVDGHAVKTWDDMRQYLFTGDGRADDGSPRTVLTVLRGDQTLIMEARPVLAGDERMRMLGVSPYESLKIAQVEPGSLAEQAGLRAGDRLVELDGVALTSGQLYVQGLRDSRAREAELLVERDGAPVALKLAPRPEAKEPADLGAVFDAERILVYRTPWEQVAGNARMTFRTLWSLLNRNSDVGLSQLSGPVGIARIFHLTAQEDVRLVLWFTILVNVNLAIFNLLPLPVLDGGHMLFATLGKLRGRALPTGFIQSAQTGFAVLLFSMMMYVTFFGDLRRILRERAPEAVEQPTGGSDSAPASDTKAVPE